MLGCARSVQNFCGPYFFATSSSNVILDLNNGVQIIGCVMNRTNGYFSYVIQLTPVQFSVVPMMLLSFSVHLSQLRLL